MNHPYPSDMRVTPNYIVLVFAQMYGMSLDDVDDLWRFATTL